MSDACPHCKGTGRLVSLTQQERQRINDAYLRNRRPGDPLPRRADGSLPPAAVIPTAPHDTEGALRNRADHVLDVVETSGVAAPRTRSMTWQELEGGGDGGEGGGGLV